MGKRSPSSEDVEKGCRKSQKSRHSIPPPHLCPRPPKPWVPWLMPLVFFTNVAIFVYTILKKLGALERQLMAEWGEGWRLLSCMWLHAGVVHLLAHMLSLLFIGIRLEQEFGFIRIGFLYVLAGLGGSLRLTLHLMRTASLTISVGASGALFGLLGAMLSELLINWTIYVKKFTALLIVMAVIAVNLAVGFIPKVDSSAHIGGFLTGFFLGFIILVRPQYGYISSKHLPSTYEGKRKSRHMFYQYVLGITAFIILVLGYTYAFGNLYDPQALKNVSF